MQLTNIEKLAVLFLDKAIEKAGVFYLKIKTFQKTIIAEEYKNIS